MHISMCQWRGLRSVVAVSFMHRLKTKNSTKESALMNRMLSAAPCRSGRTHGSKNAHMTLPCAWWLKYFWQYYREMSVNRGSRYFCRIWERCRLYRDHRGGQESPSNIKKMTAISHVEGYSGPIKNYILFYSFFVVIIIGFFCVNLVLFCCVCMVKYLYIYV